MVSFPQVSPPKLCMHLSCAKRKKAWPHGCTLNCESWPKLSVGPHCGTFFIWTIWRLQFWELHLDLWKTYSPLNRAMYLHIINSFTSRHKYICHLIQHQEFLQLLAPNVGMFVFLLLKCERFYVFANGVTEASFSSEMWRSVTEFLILVVSRQPLVFSVEVSIFSEISTHEHGVSNLHVGHRLPRPHTPEEGKSYFKLFWNKDSYLMTFTTQWSRGLPEKRESSYSRKILLILWDPNIYYPIYSSQPTAPVLSKISSVHAPLQPLEDPFQYYPPIYA
jgi:hypothetical protein